MKKPPRVFHRSIARNFNDELLPIIQNLTALGYQPNAIGQIVGFAGELSRDWLKSLMKDNVDVAEAVKTGRILAQAVTLARMIKAAMGYSYEEVDEYWEPTDEKKSNRQLKWKLKKKTVHKRQALPNLQAVLKLAQGLMPELFRNDGEGDSGEVTTEEQLTRLGGNLMNEVSRLSPAVLVKNTQNDGGKSSVSVEVKPSVGQGQKLSKGDEAVDSRMAPNSV